MCVCVHIYTYIYISASQSSCNIQGVTSWGRREDEPPSEGSLVTPRSHVVGAGAGRLYRAAAGACAVRGRPHGSGSTSATVSPNTRALLSSWIVSPLGLKPLRSHRLSHGPFAAGQAALRGAVPRRDQILWNPYVRKAFLRLQLLRTLRRGVGCVNSLPPVRLPVLPGKSHVERRRCLCKKLNLISLRIFSVSSQVCFKLMEVISESQRDFV